jgi:site-specific recombinase XerD
MKSETWLKDPKVVEWFTLLNNQRTIKNYRNEFPKFLEFVQKTTKYKTPSQIVQSRMEQLRSLDMNVKRYWETVVIKFKNSLENEGMRMNTAHSYLRTTLSFFSKNHVRLEFSRNELKVNPSEKDKVYREWIPSNEEIRLLYRMANNARDRAVLLVLYQSGFSEVDVAAMKIGDFPFYDKDGNWAIPISEDIYHQRRREKTNIWAQTCISREASEEIRIMLQSRGFPKEGYLFVSFRDQQLGVRGINDALKEIVSRAFNGRAKEWQTKHLRDAFMNGLLQAKIPQEVKDAFVGHQRQGARKDYAITELTIKTAYIDAFKFLTVNGFGSQSRKIEEIDNLVGKQQREIQELRQQLATFKALLIRAGLEQQENKDT